MTNLVKITSAMTPYECYVDGWSFHEISEHFNINLFEAMKMCADEAAELQSFAKQNPHLELQFAAAHLKKVIKQAWEEHGEEDSKGRAKNSLPTIVVASKALIEIVDKITQFEDPKAVDDETGAPKSLGLTSETTAAIAKQAVFHQFGKPQLQVVEGGK